MANLLVRNLPDEVVEELKARARRHHRPLQQEVSEILIRHAQRPDVARKAAEIRDRLNAGKGVFSDSAELLREDRAR